MYTARALSNLRVLHLSREFFDYNKDLIEGVVEAIERAREILETRNDIEDYKMFYDEKEDEFGLNQPSIERSDANKPTVSKLGSSLKRRITLRLSKDTSVNSPNKLSNKVSMGLDNSSINESMSPSVNYGNELTI